MKIMIESAEELIMLRKTDPEEGNEEPCVPAGATLVVKSFYEAVELRNADDFVLSEDVSAWDVFNKLALSAGFRLASE